MVIPPIETPATISAMRLLSGGGVLWLLLLESGIVCSSTDVLNTSSKASNHSKQARSHGAHAEVSPFGHHIRRSAQKPACRGSQNRMREADGDPSNLDPLAKSCRDDKAEDSECQEKARF